MTYSNSLRTCLIFILFLYGLISCDSEEPVVERTEQVLLGKVEFTRTDADDNLLLDRREFLYNEEGRLLEMVREVYESDQLIRDWLFTYSYDAEGRISSILFEIRNVEASDTKLIFAWGSHGDVVRIDEYIDDQLIGYRAYEYEDHKMTSRSLFYNDRLIDQVAFELDSNLNITSALYQNESTGLTWRQKADYGEIRSPYSLFEDIFFYTDDWGTKYMSSSPNLSEVEIYENGEWTTFSESTYFYSQNNEGLPVSSQIMTTRYLEAAEEQIETNVLYEYIIID